MPHLIRSRYNQGLSAYRAGHGIAHVIDVGDEIERETREAHDRIEGARVDGGHGPEWFAEKHKEVDDNGGHDAFPSIIAGFADGLIDDIRLIANRHRGGKA